MAPKYLKGIISLEVPGGTNPYYNLSLATTLKFLVKTGLGIDFFFFFFYSRMMSYLPLNYILFSLLL